MSRSEPPPRPEDPQRHTIGVAARGLSAVVGWKLALAAVAVLLPLLLFAGLFIAAASPVIGSGTGQVCSVRGAGAAGIPTAYVPWLQRAATKYRLGPRGFAIVAAIHEVESDFGRSTSSGVKSGTNSAGAAGPGQFLLSTWATYGVDADGDGRKDVYSVPDSVFATANYLRASGAPGNWRAAIFAYNHAEWYVQKVESVAARFGGTVVCRPGPVLSGGNAMLRSALTLKAPLAFKPIPAALWVGGGKPEAVDSRIWPDVVWLLSTHGLRASAARELGHQTHGDGTAVDMVPAPGRGWDDTALRAARDLGWRGYCGASGVAPTCPLVAAIEFIGYNGYPGHGDPAHAGSNAHLHVSWKGSSYGCAALCPPPRWVRVFPLAP